MRILILKSLTLLVFVVMLAINYLANALPLGGRSTGQISDNYPTLFTPSGYTFSIWGVIYIMLGVYVGLTVFMKSEEILGTYKELLMLVFIISSVFNILWLFAWHYDLIGLSTIVMVLLLATLLYGLLMIPSTDGVIKSAFSLYAGWISVALIANVSIWLVQKQFSGFGMEEVYWLIGILLIGVVIGSVFILTQNNVVYGLVFIWAYLGILIRHMAQSELNRAYPSALITLMGSMIVLIAISGYQWYLNGFKFY